MGIWSKVLSFHLVLKLVTKMANTPPGQDFPLTLFCTPKKSLQHQQSLTDQQTNQIVQPHSFALLLHLPAMLTSTCSSSSDTKSCIRVKPGTVQSCVERATGRWLFSWAAQKLCELIPCTTTIQAWLESIQGETTWSFFRSACLMTKRRPCACAHGLSFKADNAAVASSILAYDTNTKAL